MRASYENHYNQKLNSCLVILSVWHNEQGSRSMMLYDLNEMSSEPIGMFFQVGDRPPQCRVQDRRCASDADWRALIKSYMAD